MTKILIPQTPTIACLALVMLVQTGMAGLAVADYREDIEYNLLVAEIGPALPDGSAIRIDQIEASSGEDPDSPIYRANPANSSFSGVTFIDQTGGPDPGFSGHATAMALLFAGTESMTPGVATVDNYDANDWIQAVLANNGAGLQRPMTGAGILGNHSWIGTTEDDATDADVLARFDWLVAEDGFVQVVGVRNAARTLFGQAFNAISVTHTALPPTSGSRALDAFYTAGRVLAHLTAPLPTTSAAVAVVTAASAILMDTSPTNRLSAEELKAVLMAGADRLTRNTNSVDLDGWSVSSGNGIDARYGAGQLNIRNSYTLVAAGPHASAEEGGGVHPLAGYDRDSAFGGGSGSNGTATYVLEPVARGGHLAVTLAWPARINDRSGPFNPVRTLYNFDLRLLDTTGGGNDLVASSTATLDNTENLWVHVAAGHSYSIEVVNAHGTAVNWHYALAWHLDADGDGDGLPDRFETGVCPHADDADSDDDGIADGSEDADANGKLDVGETDPCSADTDGDGLQDGTERGVTSGVDDPDDDGPLRGTDPVNHVVDADPSTTSDPRLADSDADGSSDGEEDLNANGRVDEGETDPDDQTSKPLPMISEVPFAPWAVFVLGVALCVAATRGRVVKQCQVER